MVAAPAPDEPRILTVPVIRLAFALSIALHVAALWAWWPRLHAWSLEREARDQPSGPLVVELAPEPPRVASVPPAPPPAPAAAAPRPTPPPKAKAPPRPRPAPPAIAQRQPAPVVAPPREAAPQAPPALAPVEGDFYAQLEARRRARGAAPDGGLSTPPVEDERERHNRSVAANLGLDRTPTFGSDHAGGVFRIERMGFDAAEFYFFGWNPEIRRNSRQLIEVRKGDNPDIRIAVIRRMIAIIRAQAPEDFVWVSQRLGRHVTLSARPRDNAGLEDFLMREFFGA
jgi:hypothetical protein